MGAYANDLRKRIRGRMETSKPTPVDPKAERLRAVAIMRDGKVLERGFKAHWELRAALNPERHDFTKTIPGDFARSSLTFSGVMVLLVSM